jgi:hypothetical protein
MLRTVEEVDHDIRDAIKNGDKERYRKLLREKIGIAGRLTNYARCGLSVLRALRCGLEPCWGSFFPVGCGNSSAATSLQLLYNEGTNC